MSEEKKMATFKSNAIIGAAVWLALKSERPILQFRRKGDKLEVVGSNAYVLVKGEIPAEFSEGWEDGGVMKMVDHKATLALSDVLALDRYELSEHRLVGDGGCGAEYRVANSRVQFEVPFLETSGNPLTLDSLYEMVDSDPEGRAYLTSEMLRTMAKLTKIVGNRHWCWYFEPHGKNRAVTLRTECGIDPAVLIMAMPMRED